MTSRRIVDPEPTPKEPALPRGAHACRRGPLCAFPSTGEYQVLLVANKFQIDFDQSLLCGTYVDKRLAGIQAVQTLSRLNRAHPGKEATYVVGFVNEPMEVLAAFKTFFDTPSLRRQPTRTSSST